MDPLISRLLVARTSHHVTTELIDDTLARLTERQSVAECRTLRDFYIRAAADCLTGPAWQRAKTLSALIRRFHHPVDSVRRFLHLAAKAGPTMPTSPRQVYRIIEGN
jgi:alkyl sulfatase BDS1-like metallo-beta-lactamase superfamily hydrolase